MNEQTLITSHRNPKVRDARGLKRPKERLRAGLFLVEGIRHVGAALEANAPLESLFYAPDLLTSKFGWELVAAAQAKDIPCYATSAEVFEKMAEKAAPVGLLAIARMVVPSLASCTPENFPWAAAVVAPQDPGNIGTILRTVDAAGASGLILLDGGADPWHSSAVRASMGTVFWKPIIQTSFETFLAWVRQHSYTLFGTSARGTTPYRALSYQTPCVLLMGSEREGLTPDQAAACDHLARLPMAGQSTSLNLAVAAGIMLYAMQDVINTEEK